MQLSGSRHDRAQTSPLSVLLILSITLTAATVIVVFGGAALEGVQQEAQAGQAEQAMTQFDSRAAQVALGDSSSQNVNIGQQNGNYRVDGDSGAIRIYHENYIGDETEYIYGDKSEWKSLGSVVYEGGNTKIAYQGGGVWRKSADGGSTMISPPEFHYREATLTFPLIRVSGSDSTAGRTSARVTRLETANSIYPQLGVHYDRNRSRRQYVNPVQDGNMTVEIRSEYCEAWRSYLTERTEGTVSNCDSNNTVRAQLITLGTQGGFKAVSGSSLNIRGQSKNNPLNDFNLTLESNDQANRGFKNGAFEWKMATDEDAETQFEIFFTTDNSGNVHMHIYYSENGGDTYHSWTLNSSNPNRFEIEGDGRDAVIRADLLNSSRTMVYEDINNLGLQANTQTFTGDEGSFATNETINGSNYDSGSTESLENITQHYFGEAGDLDLEIEVKTGNGGGNGAGIGDDSSGVISYDGGGRVITYLHITENRIRVELN